MNRQSLVLLAIVLVAVRASAQQVAIPEGVGRAILPTEVAARTIAEAEAAGRQWEMAHQAPMQDVTGDGGSAERRCVEVGEMARVRSGDFVVAGFGGYAALWHQGYGKLAWVPVRGTADSPRPFRVIATRLDAPATPWIFETSLVRGSWYMYNGNWHLPSTGKWMLVGAIGDSWGCFIFNLQ